MNGMWDFYTFRPLKGYYPFYIYANLYELGNSVWYETSDPELYVSASTNGEKCAAMITRYSENDAVKGRKVTIDLGGADLDGAKIFVVDQNNTMVECLTARVENGKLSVWMERNSIVYIEK